MGLAELDFMETNRLNELYKTEDMLQECGFYEVNDELSNDMDDINTYFSKLRQRLNKDKIKEVDEVNQFLHEVVGEGESLNINLLNVISSDYYVKNYAGINGNSALSSEVNFNRKLEGLASVLINASEDDEYTVLSKYAEKRNMKNEKFINNDENQYGDPISGLHEDVVELFNNDDVQAIINNKKMSKAKYRQLRHKNVTTEDLKEYPEMMTMYLAIMVLEQELGLNGDAIDGEKVSKFIDYVESHNDMLKKEKEKAFSRWREGKSRLDKMHFNRLKRNPYKVEHLRVNGVRKPITNEHDLEAKWEKLLNFYGVANNGGSQYNKAKRVRNELMDELAYMRERFNPPVGFRGQNVTGIDIRRDQQEVEKLFTFSQYEMVKGLLHIDTYHSEPVKDENGKSIRHKYSFPIFQVLEDKHEGGNSYIKHHILNKFRELWADADLHDYENTIIDMIINPIHEDDKGEYREDFHGSIIDKLNDAYKMDVKDKRQLDTLIKQLSIKISNTYLDQQEIDKLGTLKCSKCEEDKVASERNFGKDKRNKKRKGFRSVCKKCE